MQLNTSETSLLQALKAEEAFPLIPQALSPGCILQFYLTPPILPAKHQLCPREPHGSKVPPKALLQQQLNHHEPSRLRPAAFYKSGEKLV